MIASHVFSPGTSQALRDYCLKKNMDVLWIEHSLFASYLNWTIDILETIWKVVKNGKKFDYFVGSNNLNAFAGIILRRLNRVNQVAYFSPDYVPNRFSNKFLNYLYHQLDLYCVRNANISWNSSVKLKVDPIMKAREEFGLEKKFRLKQIQVPDGTDPFRQLPLSKINQFDVGFVGHLRPGMGVDLIIEAFPHIQKKIPNIRFLVIGSGPIEAELKLKAQDMNIQFLGFIGDIKQVFDKLEKCSMAVAPYEPGSISQFSDPGKIKNYFTIGLPVVVTKVPVIWKEIENAGCGIATKYDPQEFADAIVKIINNKNSLSKYRKNTEKLAKKYSWDRIFSDALQRFEA